MSRSAEATTSAACPGTLYRRMKNESYTFFFERERKTLTFNKRVACDSHKAIRILASAGKNNYTVGRYSESLRTGRYVDRIPVGARFSVPVQTGIGAHPTSYEMGTGSPSRRLSGSGVALTFHPI